MLKKVDPRLLKRLEIILGVIVGIIALIIILVVIFGGRVGYDIIENRMIDAAKKYYAANPSKLPETDNGQVNVSSTTLVNEKYLKSLDKIAKNKDAACSGNVTVTKTNGNLLYSATLNCGKYYETKKLKDVILNDTEKAANGSGLYQEGENYIFKGDDPHNHVSFANKDWLILRINSDGTIRMIELTRRDGAIWDDRYNEERKYASGINDYRVSRMRDYIDDLYKNETEFSNNDKSYISNQNLCIGKRNPLETSIDGSIECADVLENQPLGIMQINEYASHSLDKGCTDPSKQQCRNYNFLANIVTWTLNADSTTTYKVFKIASSAIAAEANYATPIKLVVNINSLVNYVSGDGTAEKPYVFK